MSAGAHRGLEELVSIYYTHIASFLITRLFIQAVQGTLEEPQGRGQAGMGSISSTCNPRASSCHRMTSSHTVWNAVRWCDADSPRVRRLTWRHRAPCAAPHRPHRPSQYLLSLRALAFLSPISYAHPDPVFFQSPHCLSYHPPGGLSSSPCCAFTRGASIHARYTSQLGFVAAPLPSESQPTDPRSFYMLIRPPSTAAM